MSSVAATPVANATDAEAVFLESKDSFFQSISDEEKAQFNSCASADELVESMGSLSRGLERGLFKKVTKRIEVFSRALEPYFSVADILVQSKPEWAAIAWGSFRLVLQLASNYSSFFEKLADLMDEIKEVLPRFGELLLLVTDDTVLCASAGNYSASQRLKQSIQLFYIDLFHLFRAIAGVFTTKSAKMKLQHRFLQTVKMCWQPFDVKFSSLLSRLQAHKRIVHDEIEILNTARAMKLCQLQLKELELTGQNAARLHDIKDRQDELTKQITEAFRKLEMAKDEDAGLLQEAIRQHSAQVQMMMNLLSKSEFESTCNRIQKFICPPEFEDDLYKAQAERDEGTGSWLFEHPSMLEWATSSGTNECFFWVNGNPGCGKTTLAGSAVNELPQVIRSSGNPIPAYFFFKRSYSDEVGWNSRNASAYRAILAQILKAATTNENLMDAFTYAMRSSPQSKASPKILQDLLLVAANCIPDLIIILDAVDECEYPDEFVKDIVDIFASSKMQAKVLFFSRPSVRALQLMVAENRRITIDESFNQDDIRIYCTNGINRLIGAKLLPIEIPPIAQLADWMTSGANGMFLWARLMFVYLGFEGLAPPGRAPKARLKAIETFRYPDNLDNMYSRILGLMWSFQSYERELARQVFRWILCEKSIILAHQLHDILESSYDRSVDQEQNTRTVTRRDQRESEFSSFRDIITFACSNLVECRNVTENGVKGLRYRFIHLSVAEFVSERLQKLQPSPQCGLEVIQYFSICKADVEATLVAECLAYLRFSVPAGPLSGNMLQRAQREDVRQAFPFFPYASVYWISHLGACLACQHLTHVESAALLLFSVSEFLSTKLVLMAWTESLYIVANNSNTLILDLTERMKSWVGWATVSNFGNIASIKPISPLQDLEEFANDLIKINHEWGNSLLHAPEQIWQDVTAFTPSRFFLKTSATTVMPLVSDDPIHKSISSHPLCMISESLPDSSEVAILGIWPTRTFQTLFRNLEPIPTSKLCDECDHWVARYQIWDIQADNPELKEEYAIPLSMDEVRLQVWYFTREVFGRPKDPEKNSSAWGQSRTLLFPTAIKKTADLSTFIVLRTVYTICRQRNSTVIQPILPKHKIHVLTVSSDVQGRIWSLGWTSRANMLGYYAYGIHFSDCGRYIVFWDTNRGIHSNWESQPVVALEVFRAPPPVLSLGLAIYESLPLLGHFGCELINSFIYGWSFHPNLPLLALHLCTNSSLEPIPRLALWRFDGEGPSPRIENIQYLPDTAQRIEFSDCGTNIIVWLHRNPARPRIYSVGSSKLLKADMRPSSAIPNTTSSEPTEDNQHQIEGVISQNHSTSHTLQKYDATKLFQGVALARSGVTGVNLVRIGDDVTETQPILALPHTVSQQVINASVQMPMSRNDKITIILNRAGQSVHKFLSRTGIHDEINPPIVVKKDQRAIPRSLKRRLLEISTGKADLDEKNRKSVRF